MKSEIKIITSVINSGWDMGGDAWRLILFPFFIVQFICFTKLCLPLLSFYSVEVDE
jgi:hypothetical protein